MQGTVPPDWIAGAPRLFWIVSAAVTGGAIGSFLNVCIYRMPRRCMTISRPKHSRCPKCGHDIRWYENIPIVSWLALRGKCSGCAMPISPRYPAIEALTAAFFGLTAWLAVQPNPSWLNGIDVSAWEAGPVHGDALRLAWFAVAALFISGLIVATFVDFEFRIIPDQISITGAWLAPALSFVLPWLHHPILRVSGEGPVPPVFPGWPHFEGLVASLLGAFVAAFSIWLVGFLGKVAFRKEAMGFGDVKLMAWIGGLIGWKAAIGTFLLASCAGAAVGVPVLLANKVTNGLRVARGKEPIPFDNYLAFGPYLAGAGLAIFLFYSQLEFFLFHTYMDFINGLFERARP